MRSALGLARRGLGQVWPNPAVGCILVQGDRVVGRGRTAPGGRPHAETAALAEAGDAARGATAYVTLEPCAHTGRTPPCATALAAAGVTRVVVALEDPDPRVNGKGIAILRASGAEVTVGCLAREAMTLNRGFLSRVTTGRPLMTLKLAATLDGRIATATGESRWITGARARADVHLLRAQSDAVLIGRTARADDPRLDVRGLGLEAVRPVRVVLSSGLSLPQDGYLARTALEVPLWLCHGPAASDAARDAWRLLGAELIEVPEVSDGALDLAGLMQQLGQRGLTRILCEGGGVLAASVLEADLVHEIVLYSAGLILGAGGVPAIAEMVNHRLSLAPRFRLVESVTMTPDVRTRWRRKA